MAGSQSDKTPLIPFSDPILAARLEAIRQLAGGLSERVAVMDRDLNVIYANESAWAANSSGKTAIKPAKCYEAFAHHHDPCGTCQAVKVFESPEVQSVSCISAGDGTACGMYQAFPLATAQGEVGLMLVLFKPSSKAASSRESRSSRSCQASGLYGSVGPQAGRSSSSPSTSSPITSCEQL